MSTYVIVGILSFLAGGFIGIMGMCLCIVGGDWDDPNVREDEPDEDRDSGSIKEE